jgi:hypothetical protein
MEEMMMVEGSPVGRERDLGRSLGGNSTWPSGGLESKLVM